MADKETEQIKKLNQTVHSKDTRERDQAYNDYVKQVTPTHNLIFHMVKAFFTGGIICCIGQFILNTCGGACADHRFCQRCGCPGDRVSERRAGFWNRM